LEKITCFFYYKKSIRFVLPDEAETGSAEEQPARNNQVNWNDHEVGVTSTSFLKNILVSYALKNL
jgi:hypothetical protein